MNRYHILIAGLLFGGLAANAVAAGPIVISAATVQGVSGKDVEVPVTIKNAGTFGAASFRLTYDPSVLEGSTVEVGNEAAPELMDFKFFPDGHAGMGLASSKGLSGDVVLKVSFHVRGGAGQSSPLKIDRARAWDVAKRDDMLITAQDGQLIVIASGLTALSPWWWIAAAVLGGLFLVLLLVRKVRAPGGSKGSRERKRTDTEEELPTYGIAPTFKHHCTECQQVIELPGAALGRSFKCAGCGAMQTGGN